MLLGIIGWIVLGLLVGVTATKVVKLNGDDPRIGLALGIGGALIGGTLYSIVTGSSVSGFNVLSMIAAAIGGALAVAAWHVKRGREAPVDYQNNRRYR